MRVRPKPWFERRNGRELLGERAIVEEHYPDLAFRVDADSGLMCLQGNISLQADCGVLTEVLVRIVFPPGYPDLEPVAFDAAGRFQLSDDRHIIAGGRFCLWLPPCSRWDKNDPNRLLRFLDEVTVFLERQLIYDATGGKVWPGSQYEHGKAGYEQFMLSALGGSEVHFRALFPVIVGQYRLGRNDHCPCGSNRKYKRCHAKAVEEIVSRIGRGTLNYLYKKRQVQRDASMMHAS
jgi:hypothetical protein